ncbi:hypothetical protein SAE02_61290 [Skermanella aerolata]|uniref:Uncharacterized protein n=1 Tax=Skermanella aerolata TaxID=393310 RepID=A0A512DZT3_9PROT|nr:hypothetical protein [Skermanella aerolata]KJB91912.1 hypothetical protein N826_25685 [Skermanella aerolata KACC 11604]GEO41981.1 hypothetical protein SAE02_61290 [Skermanella aerolata]
MVYTSLSTHRTADGHFECCQATVAANLKRSRGWVHAGASELERRGFISIERVFMDGLQRPSRYRLLDGMGRSHSVSDADSPVHPVGQTPADDGKVPGATDEDDRRIEEDGRCQPAAASRQPAAARCQPADTSQESQIQDSLSQGRAGEAHYPGTERSRETEADPVIPPDWRPNPDDVAWALELNHRLDIEAFTARFVLACRAGNYRYADFRAAWRLWLIDPRKPLPLINQTSRSGDTAHADFIRVTGVSGAGNRDKERVRPRENRTFERRGRVGLAADNATRARDCLGRIMARRPAGAPAGYPG